MILDREPINMYGVSKLLADIPENEKKEQIEQFLKKFMTLKPAQAAHITKALEDLSLLKMKREHIVKVVDIVPVDASDLQKIFSDVSLTEDEAKKILEIVSQNK